eukprot:Opistho-2@64127
MSYSLPSGLQSAETMTQSAPASFSSLPIEVVERHIVSFLSNVDCASLACVNSRLRCALRHMRVYILRRAFAKQYAESTAFRNALWAHIPRHRLSLNLSGATVDVSSLDGVRSLNLSDCKQLTDVSALGGVHFLNLSGCCRVTDVSSLGGVHSLNLTGCYGVTDVSALGSVHSLDLSYCEGVLDVSALGGVHWLNLKYCDNVTDVSTLGGVHSLNLTGCKGVTNASALGGVHSLNLS